jgi:acyl dehydratase
MPEVTKQEAKRLVGAELGASDWFRIDEEIVNRFVDATSNDARAQVESGGAQRFVRGGTTALELLTLSLVVRLCRSFAPQLEGTKVLVNYGFDRIRFVAPVEIGSRIRAIARLTDVAEPRPRRVLTKLDVTVEIEAQRDPALVAEWWSLHVLAPMTGVTKTPAPAPTR